MSTNSRSCDACRIAKVRCTTRSLPSHAGPLDTTAVAVVSPSSPPTCNRCAARGGRCTFRIPLKRPGPKSRQQHAGSSPFSTFSISDMSGPSPGATTADDASPTTSHNPHNNTSVSETSSSPAKSSLPGDTTYSPAMAALCAESSRWVLSTDRICSRRVFDVMLQDFLDLQYPLMPLVHRPSFRRDLEAARETTDAIFFSLLAAMCAALVANVPSTFYKYKALDDSFPYQTRSEMIDYCHDVVMQLRRPDYPDEATHDKWSIAYLLGVAHGNLYQRRRAMMHSAEADHHLRQRVLDHYSGSRPVSSKIELQLLCKAVCLSLVGYFHRLEIDPNEPPPINEARMSSLTHWKDTLVEVEDECVLEDSVMPKEDNQTSLATGLKVLTHLYDLASETRRLSREIEVLPDSANPVSPAVKQNYLERLRAGFEKQKHALDDVPKEFDEWTINGTHRQQTDPVLARQFEIMRANIRVTHLWLQSLIFEDIVSLSMQDVASPEGPGSREPSVSLRRFWDDRENICRQLLHVLYNISHDNLAPNGASLVQKIRVVAATLLDCPFELQGSIARQAHSYIQAFADVLSTLDGANDTACSLDVWTHLDLYERRAVPDFS